MFLEYYLSWYVFRLALISLCSLRFLKCELIFRSYHLLQCVAHVGLWKGPDESFAWASARHLRDFTAVSLVFILISLLGFLVSDTK